MSTQIPKHSLEMFEVNGGKWDKTEKVLHLTSPHLLTQVAGYAKFKKGPSNTSVYFRGQGKKFPSFKAGIYRSNANYGMNFVHKRHAAINKYVDGMISAQAFLNGSPAHVAEPILQHYGLRTRWVDFVDNIWIALWFACHDYFCCGPSGRFAHFERRSIGDGSKYAYIEIAGFENLIAVETRPGFYQSNDFEFCDLRVGSPSLYIRPHAQHGVMVRKRLVSEVAHTDLSDCLFGTVRMTLADALSWLGHGELLSIHSLFPSPYYDLGYRLLLEKAVEAPKELGSITFIGA